MDNIDLNNERYQESLQVADWYIRRYHQIHDTKECVSVKECVAFVTIHSNQWLEPPLAKEELLVVSKEIECRLLSYKHRLKEGDEKMDWLFIDNHADKIEAFNKAGIPWVTQEITAPKKATGLAFPEEYIEKVREITGIPAKYIAVKTNVDGVSMIEEWSPVVIRNPGDTGFEHWGEIKPELDAYAKQLGVKIVASNPHGKMREPVTKEGELHIMFYSSADPGCSHRQQRQAFGVSLAYDGHNDAVSPSGKGIQIFDETYINDDEENDEFSNIVAEIIGGTIYVLFDLPHGPKAGYLMAEIMKRYASIIMSPEEIEKHKQTQKALEEKRKKRELAASRRNYIKVCNKRIEDSIKKARDNIVSAEIAIEDASTRIVQGTRTIEEANMQIASLQADSKTMEERFVNEYENLMNLPMLKDLKVTSKCISAFTKTIYFEHKGKVYELGDYQIDIYTNGSIQIDNLRVAELTKQTYYHHPHVFGARRNNTCFGNINTGLMRLIGQHEYSVAVQIIIEFLHTVRDDTSEPTYIEYLKKHWKPMKTPPRTEVEAPEKEVPAETEKTAEKAVEAEKGTEKEINFTDLFMKMEEAIAVPPAMGDLLDGEGAAAVPPAMGDDGKGETATPPVKNNDDIKEAIRILMSQTMKTKTRPIIKGYTARKAAEAA